MEYKTPPLTLCGFRFPSQLTFLEPEYVNTLGLMAHCCKI